MSVSRPGKLSHAQTMLYEIDMLRHTARRIDEGTGQDDMDKWGILESFLVHFRNLIEFFGNPNPWRDDLTIRRPETFWPNPADRPTQVALAALERPDLWDKYEGRALPDKISRYLHHCTEQRIASKNWEVGDMYNELKPTIDQFEKLLPNTRTWASETSVFLGSVSANTATVIGSVSRSTASGGRPSPNQFKINPTKTS